MTQFTKETILSDGMYVYYAANGIMTPWKDRKSIARFKHKGPITKAKFLKTLIKNYTVEEYFARTDKGEAPTEVFKNDGLLTFNHETMKFTLEGKVL